MAHDLSGNLRGDVPATVKAVLGPTNTGKTHLAIERLCAHSSGAIGFPLRLLAREVYDRVCAIKGESRVALITGEERIEPRDARWLLCTAEAMPVSNGELAFVALDEAQLSGDRERGHIFTDRLLHARGREETMILGSAALEPMIKSLLPQAEVTERPRFSTLSHVGAKKLSRIPPRSAIVAFSAEQVYTIAEMLRRFRGGSAVVMGALSPQTRNAQVELYQSGEVDYLVATDAIGMGLNLDIEHVAFAGLSKFDGVRQRRLTPAEMAQIAGRAGRHQRDGTFGTLAGTSGHDAELSDEEVYAIEEHRFPPLTKLFWREAEPRFDDLATLIADLEAPPDEEGLVPAPEAIDLAVLKRLGEQPEISGTVRGQAAVARFWEACSLPDFRQQGTETHSRFVARLWRDLRDGHLGADYVAQAISQLDNVSGDIDTLQGRIAAIRSWAYIAQRPDWVRAKDEMAARARAVESRLSDALHARLTERFINRRTAVLMKRLGTDARLLSVRLDGDDVLVEDEAIGMLRGFSFRADPQARHSDFKLLLAAAEKHVPALLAERASALCESIKAKTVELALSGATISGPDGELARLAPGQSFTHPGVVLERAASGLPEPWPEMLRDALGGWLSKQFHTLAPLRKLETASTSREAGPELRALLIRLVESGGMIEREGSGIDRLDKLQRSKLAKLGVKVGALDLFVPAMLKPHALALFRTLAKLRGKPTGGEVKDQMPPVLPARKGPRPKGYRKASKQWIRLDLAERLLRDAHHARAEKGKKPFRIDSAVAISMGLTPASHAQLLRLAGFRRGRVTVLAEGAHGPPVPIGWRWKPVHRHPRKTGQRNPPKPEGAFAVLAELVR